MKIVLLTGSHREDGTSFLLADNFIKGAQEAGHEVFRFNAAFKNIHGCNGCDVCGMNGPCVQKDDIENELINQLVNCDMIVLCSPMYFFGMTAQLKTCIDRFYSRTGRIHGKRSALLLTCAATEDWMLKPIHAHYNRLVEYMEWRDLGRVIAKGCAERKDLEKTSFVEDAYKLGKSL